ncbi:unnamed protein product [Lepeophtheirus salmonis]|uniref:(salmon louse) hypothetical protein n=1 Tax=Lepeophtheirus salmonis TaxID=72036 RepID=A0A0K2UGS6_LEPSM|nr:unnamed protein product [Lepeophtheirus salmonis]CAF2925054.1 unnamed protein product [Lepeophtheirus salmonis]
MKSLLLFATCLIIFTSAQQMEVEEFLTDDLLDLLDEKTNEAEDAIEMSPCEEGMKSCPKEHICYMGACVPLKMPDFQKCPEEVNECNGDQMCYLGPSGEEICIPEPKKKNE